MYGLGVHVNSPYRYGMAAAALLFGGRCQHNDTHKFQRVQRVEQNRTDYQLQANIATSLRKLHFKTSLRDVTSPWKSIIAKEDPMVSSRSC